MITLWRTPDGLFIRSTDPYTDSEGTQYPADWDKAAILELEPAIDTAKPELEPFERLEDGGWVKGSDGIWRRVWVVTPWSAQEIAADLESQRQRKFLDINNAFQQAADALTAGYPQAEKDTWPDQKADALAWEASPDTAVTPYIDKLAQYRGIPRELYLQKTLAKVKAYMAAAQYLVGIRQRYVDAANTAPSHAQLDAIIVSYQLPG